MNQSPPILELSLGLLKVSWTLSKTEGCYEFTCFCWSSGWQKLQASTYMTNMPEDVDLGVLLAASQRIIESLEEKGVGYFRAKPSEYQPALELLSWMSPEHFGDRYVLANQNKT